MALGAEAGTIELLPRRSLYDLESIAAAQAGMLSCEWDIPADDESGTLYGGSLSIQVLPAAEAEFHAYGRLFRSLQVGWAEEYPWEPPVVSGLIGTDSLLSCYVRDSPVPSEYQSCWGSLEASGYWVNFRFSSFQSPSPDVESQTQAGILVGEALHDSLNAAGPPRAMYELPSGTVGAWESCAALEGEGELQQIAGSPTLTLRRHYSGVEMNSELAALPQGPYQTCFWDQAVFPDEEHYPYACDDCPYPEGYVEPIVNPDEAAFVSVSILPGGEWAWPEVKGRFESMDPADLALIGASDAISSCGPESGGWCEIFALVGHSVVRIRFSYYGDGTDTRDSTPRAVQLMRYVLTRLN